MLPTKILRKNIKEIGDSASSAKKEEIKTIKEEEEPVPKTP
jgi:hypothetical protein